MSGFIAVSVSLIGLSGVLFTLAILIQMIVSFPAMLSSNSHAYVQQQRKTYHISAGPGLAEIEDAEQELDFEQDQDQQQQQVDDTVERWIDVVDEAMNDLNLGLETTQHTQERRFRSARRAETIARGRPLRRRRRTITTRPGLRSKNTRRLDDQSDDDFEMEQMDDTKWQSTRERRHCNSGWRKSMEWT